MDVANVVSTARDAHAHTPPRTELAQGRMTHTFLSRVLPTVLQHDNNGVSRVQLRKNLCQSNPEIL